MPEPTALTPYPADSVEAQLRVIVMFAISDGAVDTAEVEVLDRLGILDGLGADRERLTRVAREYFRDLDRQAARQGHVNLNDDAWVDAVLGPVRAPEARLTLARLLLVMARSDGVFSDPELALLGRVLGRWGLTLDDLGGEKVVPE